MTHMVAIGQHGRGCPRRGMLRVLVVLAVWSMQTQAAPVRAREGPHPVDCSQIIRNLAARDSAGARNALLERLTVPVQEESCGAWRVPCPGLFPVLEEIARNDRDAAARLLAWRNLNLRSSVDPPATMAVMYYLLSADADPLVRREVLRSLSSARFPELKTDPRLLRLLDTAAEPETKERVLEDLQRHGSALSDPALDAVLRAFRNPGNEGVRGSAARLLCKAAQDPARSWRIGPVLLGALGADPSSLVRGVIAHGMVNAPGWPSASIPVLLRCVESDPHHQVRYAAARALVCHQATAGLDGLAAIQRTSPSAEQRSLVAAALAERAGADARVLQRLIDALRVETDPAVLAMIGEKLSYLPSVPEAVIRETEAAILRCDDRETARSLGVSLLRMDPGSRAGSYALVDRLPGNLSDCPALSNIHRWKPTRLAPEAVPVLVRRLRDDRGDADALRIIWVLEKCAPSSPVVSAELARLLRVSPSAAVRSACARALGEMDDSVSGGAEAALEKALSDSDPSVRLDAHRALVSRGSAAATDATPADVLTSSTDPYTRLEAVRAIECAGKDSAAGAVALQRAFEGETDSHVRMNAAGRLAGLGLAGPLVVPEMRPCLEEDSPTRTAEFAVRVLECYSEQQEESVRMLLRTLGEHPDALVRRTAAAALAKVGPTVADPLQRAMCSDSEPEVRDQAALSYLACRLDKPGEKATAVSLLSVDQLEWRGKPTPPRGLAELVSTMLRHCPDTIEALSQLDYALGLYLVAGHLQDGGVPEDPCEEVESFVRLRQSQR